MIASQCDLLDVSGQVDAFDSLPADAQDIIADPKKLFDRQSGSLMHGGRIPKADVAEYAKLVARQVRCGKVVLDVTAKASASVFAVGKSNDKQRA